MDAESEGEKSPTYRTDRSTAALRAKTAENKQRWLVEYEKHRHVKRACDATGIGETTVYDWREDDQEFKASWRKAQRGQVEQLIQSAMRRATFGTKRPVFYEGEIVGHVIDHESNLTKFMLEKRAPEIFGDRPIGSGMPEDLAKKAREFLAAAEPSVAEESPPEPSAGP